MKQLKVYHVIMITGIIISCLYSCNRCKDEDPRARVTNHSTAKISVQIKTTGGNTVNINNVDPGTSSPYTSYAAGNVTFTIKLNGADYVENVLMLTCYDYDIVIDNNRNITTSSVER